MQNQYQTYQTTLRQELEQIETSFMDERKSIIESNLAEFEKLLETRRANEGFGILETGVFLIVCDF